MIAASWIWAAIVFVLHVVQIESEGNRRKLIPHLDKVVHFTMFAVLAFLMYRALSSKTLQQGRNMLLIFFVCMAYGAAMEYVQAAYFVGRDGDPLDWFADLTGTICALVFARWLKVIPAQ